MAEEMSLYEVAGPISSVYFDSTGQLLLYQLLPNFVFHF